MSRSILLESPPPPPPRVFELPTRIFVAGTDSFIISNENRQKSFKLLELIGQGSFGRVFRAQRNEDSQKRDWALKIMIGAFSDEQKTMLDREIAILNYLPQSPYYVRYEDSFTAKYRDKDRRVVQMEYVDGVDLETFINVNKARPKIIFALLRDCLLGLSQLHRYNVYHLDIKPRNILVRSTEFLGPKPVFIDFGISCTARQIPTTAIKTECVVVDALSYYGTQGFMSPARVGCFNNRGCAQLNTIREETDLWALGMSFLSALNFNLYADNLMKKGSWETEQPYPPDLVGAKKYVGGSEEKERKIVNEMIELLCGPASNPESNGSEQACRLSSSLCPAGPEGSIGRHRASRLWLKMSAALY